MVRKLRAEGLLPGVIYGTGIEPVALAVPRSELLKTLHAHGAHPLVTIKIETKDKESEDPPTEYLALVKDLQIDHVKQVALHVDFHRVQADKPVQTEVEVRLFGEPAGVKLGGILDITTRMVTVEALPRDLPESIELDVSFMELGDVVRVSDLAVPAGVTILTDPEESLASVVAPRVEQVELSAEDAEALGALSPDELEALQELAAPTAAAESGEGEASGESSEAPKAE